MQALRLGIHWHIISGMSKAWVHSNKWLKTVLTQNPRIEKSINLWLPGSWRLYAVKNDFIFVLHSFSKHPLLTLVGMSIPGRWAIAMGLISILLPSEMTSPSFHSGDLGKHRREVDAYVSLVAGQSALVNRAASCVVLFFFLTFDS